MERIRKGKLLCGSLPWCGRGWWRIYRDWPHHPLPNSCRYTQWLLKENVKGKKWTRSKLHLSQEGDGGKKRKKEDKDAQDKDKDKDKDKKKENVKEKENEIERDEYDEAFFVS